MLLSEYVRTVIADPDHYSKQMIQVDPTLLQRLSNLRDLSEEGIRELGLLLRWQSTVRRVMTTTVIAGTRTAVDWNPAWFTQTDYVGTVHTHPYRKKLGEKAAVGFSFQDFVFYAEAYPLHLPISVNFVVSNKILYLAIFREATQKTISDQLFRDLNTDEIEADNLIRARGRWNEALTLAGEVDLLQAQGNVDDSAELEREFYTSIPGYVDLRMAANKRMIRRAAQTLRFDFYEGKLGSTLNLQSTRVYAK